MIATAIKEVKEIKWDSFLFEIDNHIKKWEKFQRNPDLLYNVDISELKALKNDAHSLMRQRYTKFKSYKRNSEWRKYEDRLESMVKGIDKVLGTKVGR
jgi:hypothetical protein